ncbi:MAG: hypothetical protein M1818_007019 [Claussenomyces sp. TS43310]|nr:MAG: hypothetical protein M1818_007019 [Claussenomyces sp. TS43310]
MKQSESHLDVAIIGAGIGGLALAIGLLHQNVPFTLYEAAAEYATVGAGVGLGPNALRAMDLIDARLKALYDEISTGNLTPDRDHVMMDVMLVEEGLGKNQGWEPAAVSSPIYLRTSAHRKALLDVMTSLIPLSTVKFGKRIKTMRQVEGKVILTFEDGEVAKASCVVGCDGIKGATRQAVLGPKHPDQVDASFSGKFVYRAIMPMKDAQDILGDYAGDAKMFMGDGVNMMLYPISNGTQVNIVAFKLQDGPWTHDQLTKEVSRDEMITDFESVGADERLIKVLDWAKPVRWALWHHVNTPVYYNGLVCLVGDSAHATTPHQAAGAGQCFEDALILSRLLGLVRKRGDTESALKIYDSIRRPRAQKICRTSQEAGLIYAFRDPKIGSDMNSMMQNLRQRFLWIWEHDLEADVRKAEEDFKSLTRTRSWRRWLCLGGL